MKEELLNSRKKDPFKTLGVSAEDKMSFFLLKWVFNAIKQDSDEDDAKLKGKKFMKKAELVQQLSQNSELMDALEIKSNKDLKKMVRQANCVKEGCLTWEEFLSFFFCRNGSYAEQVDGEQWWNNLDEDGNHLKAESTPTKDQQSNQMDLFSDSKDGDESSGAKRRNRNYG